MPVDESSQLIERPPSRVRASQSEWFCVDWGVILENINFSLPIMIMNLDSACQGVIIIKLLSDLPSSVLLLSTFDLIINAENLSVSIFITPIQLVSIPFSQRLGAYERRRDRRALQDLSSAMRNYRRMGLILGVSQAVLMPLCISPLLDAIGISDNRINIIQQYFILRGLTYWLETGYYTARQLTYVLKKPWMAALLTGLGLGLLYGSGEALYAINEDLGGMGIALAFSINDLLQLYFYHKIFQSEATTFLPLFSFDFTSFTEQFSELVGLSWPLMIRNFVLFGSGLARASIVNSYGKDTLIMDLVVSKYLAFISGLGSGLSTSCGIKTSELIGMREYKDIPKVLAVNMGLISIVNLAWMITVFSVPIDSLMKAMTDEIVEDQENMWWYMLLFSISQLLDTFRSPVGGLLIGLRDIQFTVAVESAGPLISALFAFLLSQYTYLGDLGIPLGFIISSALMISVFGMRVGGFHNKIFTEPESYSTPFLDGLVGESSEDIATLVAGSDLHPE